MSKLLFAAPLAVALAVAGAGCAPDVPANPTYTKDVGPIFDAHCVRCHGANDMLNSMIINKYPNSPAYCYLQHYQDEGDCSVPTNPDCKMGAGSSFCRSQVVSYINLPDPGSRMPPAPSEPLNDWEKEVIGNWVLKGGPQ